MATKMSGQLRRLGGRNALIVSVGILIAFGIVTAAVAVLTPGGIGDASGVAALLIFATIFLGGLLVWFQSRAKAGAVLLDAGYVPWRKLYLFNAAISLLMAMAYFVQPPPPSASVYFRAFPFLFFTLALYAALSAFGRLQVREGGIWGYWGLLPWHKIASYSWVEEATLLVQVEGWAFIWSGGFRVAPEHRAALNAYLERYTT